MKIKRTQLVSWMWQVGTIVGLLVIWEWAARTHPAPFLPHLQNIVISLLKLWNGEFFYSTIFPSMIRLCKGFFIAVTLGIAMGIMLGNLRSIDPWVRPVLEYLRFIPAVAILPAALLLFGPTDTMRIFVIAFGSVFPILLSAIDGARRVDPVLIDVARVNGLSIPERLVQVILPAALPTVFAGVRIALSIALVMMVISELIAADDGLGFYILRNQRLFQTANVYAGVITIGVIGLTLTLILLTIERRVLAWHRGWRGLLIAD